VLLLFEKQQKEVLTMSFGGNAIGARKIGSYWLNQG
jgi:hypothetical protein